MCSVNPIAASLIASAGSLMKWKVSLVGCFVCVSVAILTLNSLQCGVRGKILTRQSKKRDIVNEEEQNFCELKRR